MPRKYKKKEEKLNYSLTPSELSVNNTVRGILKLPEARQKLVARNSSDSRVLKELAIKTEYSTVIQTIENNPNYQVKIQVA